MNPSEIKQNFQKETPPDILFYYATPHIGKSDKGEFSLEKFHHFNKFYIDGFLNLYSQLQENLKAIFYPSTIFISTKPTGMWEYISSKNVAESICEQIEKEHKNVIVFNPRLPKVNTDQTAELLRSEKNNTMPVMVKIFQEFIDKLVD